MMSVTMHDEDETLKAEAQGASSVTDVLVANHRDFLRFVELRVGDRGIAEEIVQDAFVRSLDRGDEIRESVVGWFYRVLRNAVIDRQRRQAFANRRLDQLASELESNPRGNEEATGTVCRCVTRLADTLKPEYADALHRIEIDGVATGVPSFRGGMASTIGDIITFCAARAAPAMETGAPPRKQLPLKSPPTPEVASTLMMLSQWLLRPFRLTSRLTASRSHDDAAFVVVDVVAQGPKEIGNGNTYSRG